MKPKVYVETSVIGHLASRLSRDLITAANQQITHEWWRQRRHEFDLVKSEFVVMECEKGDAEAVQERSVFLANLSVLDATENVTQLAEQLLTGGLLPEKAKVDALYIAICAVHGIDYLLTWNCTHIANAALRQRIEDVCRSLGFKAPIICTPQELMED